VLTFLWTSLLWFVKYGWHFGTMLEYYSTIKSHGHKHLIICILSFQFINYLLPQLNTWATLGAISGSCSVAPVLLSRSEKGTCYWWWLDQAHTLLSCKGCWEYKCWLYGIYTQRGEFPQIVLRRKKNDKCLYTVTCGYSRNFLLTCSITLLNWK
jgi:hypothetical protein